MDSRKEIRDFLTSRRARIKPEEVGLPNLGGHRRVPGLRREEVALLAGVSVDYYTRLERGNARGVSVSVLAAIARTLRLDEAEREHLFDLARTSNTAPGPRRGATTHAVRPSVRRVIDSISAPAYLRTARMDILATNQLGRALFAPVFTDQVRPANLARFMFLDPRAVDFFVDWERLAADTVALLRAEAGRNPYDRALSDLIGELATRSDMFRTRWAAHNVRFRRTGVKHIHHPVVGDLSLTYEAMRFAEDDGPTLIAYSAEPGSSSEDALNLLASWAATPDHDLAIPES